MSTVKDMQKNCPVHRSMVKYFWTINNFHRCLKNNLERDLSAILCTLILECLIDIDWTYPTVYLLIFSLSLSFISTSISIYLSVCVCVCAHACWLACLSFQKKQSISLVSYKTIYQCKCILARWAKQLRAQS